MKSIGNIPLLVQNDKYSINFDYAFPRKLDLFELILLEIIRHSDNFPGQSIRDVLQMMEIPRDFHGFLQERLADLINTGIVDYPNQDTKNILDLVLLYNDSPQFTLTPIGVDVYQSKELAEEKKSFSGEYVYESAANKLVPVPKGNTADENKCFILDMSVPDLSAITENEHAQMIMQKTFTEIVMKNLKLFINVETDERTKIFELKAIPIEPVTTTDRIEIMLDTERRNISFQNKNEKIRKAFLNIKPEVKQQLRSKEIFNYLDITQTQVDFDRARISQKHQPIKMNSVFGNEEAINKVAIAENIFPISAKDMSKLNTTESFCFAGITESGQPLVFNYCEINSNGFDIPLEDVNYTLQSFNPVFKAFSDLCASMIEKNGNHENIIKTLIACAPEKERYPTINNLLCTSSNLQKNLDRARIILPLVKSEERQTVIKLAGDSIDKNLKAKKIKANTVIEILKTYDFLPKKPIIRMLADFAPKTDEIINALLVYDEKAVIDAYELKKLYNSLLRSGKLDEISHKTNLYAIFADYDGQYKKLQTLGVKDYYTYDAPENWDKFMNEVNALKQKYQQIKQYLENDIVKQASGFFERVQNDYNKPSSVGNEETLKNGLEEKDFQKLKKAIYDAVSHKQLIACAGLLKSNYEEYLRNKEKLKDPHADGSRKGKNLIGFTVDIKYQKDCYTNWCNLNVILSKENEDSILKKDIETRRTVLINALDFYVTKLYKDNNSYETNKQWRKK